MEFSLNQVVSAEKAAIEWLVNSYGHGKGGFPHSRWMFLPANLAWNKDYAETTGYLIENLLVYNAGIKPGISQIAESAGKWLLSIQAKEGCFHSGTSFVKPSAFNTAQVLFGLDALYLFTNDEKYFIGLSKAFHWLIDAIDQQGILSKGLYVDGYYAAYYTRALWPLMLVDQKYFNSKHSEKLVKAIDLLYNYKNEFGFMDNTGFCPGKASLLHTVIYTLEGFYECSKVTNKPEIKSFIIDILDRICKLIQQKQKTPASLNPDFKADFSIVCVSGQAQLCALLLKVYSDHGNEMFKKTAILLFRQLMNWQVISNSAEHHGALPSSIPVWKNYFPFRYTNWTMKFFLDACGLMKKIV